MNTDTPRGTKVERACKRDGCGVVFLAREADVKRGWAKFCSKSCKASAQEQRTQATRRHYQRQAARSESIENAAAFDANEAGWDGHKNAL